MRVYHHKNDIVPTYSIKDIFHFDEAIFLEPTIKFSRGEIAPHIGELDGS